MFDKIGVLVNILTFSHALLILIRIKKAIRNIASIPSFDYKNRKKHTNILVDLNING